MTLTSARHHSDAVPAGCGHFTRITQLLFILSSCYDIFKSGSNINHSNKGTRRRAVSFRRTISSVTVGIVALWVGLCSTSTADTDGSEHSHKLGQKEQAPKTRHINLQTPH